MASVDGKTSIKIDELINATVVSGHVASNRLILVTRGGAEIDAGSVEASAPDPLLSMPVGYVYMSVDSTDPGTLFGGTWARIAQGRVLVGQDGTQSEFDTSEETGGEKTHTISAGEMPVHTHTISHDHASFTSGAAGNHSHTLVRKAGAGTVTGVTRGNSTAEAAGTTDAVTDHTHAVDVPAFTGNSSSSGGGTPANNLQPYLVVFMWKRTA